MHSLAISVLLFKSLSPFYYWFVFLFLIDLWEFLLCVLQKYFLPFCSLPFYCFSGIFGEQKFFLLINLTYLFLLWVSAFCGLFEKSLPSPSSWRYSLRLPSRKCILFCVWVHIPPGIDFCVWEEVGTGFMFIRTERSITVYWNAILSGSPCNIWGPVWIFLVGFLSIYTI